MTTDVSTSTKTTYHREHLLDRAGMLAMRAMIALRPAADPGPGGRAAFDELWPERPWPMESPTRPLRWVASPTGGADLPTVSAMP
ncbi:MAG: hypothetical protein QOD93_5819 [Acetobacteraceae bacterium]|nr:hypothetical protein [Acetobacteraceae bacterium]MEA2772857.1 hypothetical protein [Acetobacteraceae bacterium]